MCRNRIAVKQFCCGNIEISDQCPLKISMLPIKAQHCHYLWCVGVLGYHPSKASLPPWVAELCWQRAAAWACLQHWNWNGEGMYTNTTILCTIYKYFFLLLMLLSWPGTRSSILLLSRCKPDPQKILQDVILNPNRHPVHGLQCNSSSYHPSAQCIFWTVAMGYGCLSR